MKTKKFKIWAAVDDNGNLCVYVSNKPYYIHYRKYWINDARFVCIGCDHDLKAGEDAIEEVEFEFPLKEEE